MAGFGYILWGFIALLAMLCTVEADKLQLTKQNRLATLFVSPNFKGNYYALNGIYASCYNVLKEGSVGSILLDAVTSHCEIWAVEECGGDSDGKDRPREIFQDVEKVSWFGMREGRTKNEVKRMIGASGVRSVRCFEKR